jgi:hypothetical protein
MRTLTAELRLQFDIILIDSPPMAGLADALVLASLSDAVIIVVRTNLTTPSGLTAAARSLGQTHTPIAGVVVFEDRLVESYYPVAREDNGAWDRADVAESTVSRETAGARKSAARKSAGSRKRPVVTEDPVDEKRPSEEPASKESPDADGNDSSTHDPALYS